MTITLAGSGENGNTSLAYTIVGTGNLIILLTDQGATGAVTAVNDTNSRISWQSSATVEDIDTGSGSEVGAWYGTTNSTGSTTINVTWAGTNNGPEIVVLELHESTPGQTWSIAAHSSLNGGGGGISNYPSLTSASSGDQAYVGLMTSASVGTGSTTGFTFVTSSNSNDYTYNLSLAASTTYQPSANPSGAYDSVAIIVRSVATPPIIDQQLYYIYS